MNCPKCNGPTIEKVLFTGWYNHCNICDAIGTKPIEKTGKVYLSASDRLSINDVVCLDGIEMTTWRGTVIGCAPSISEVGYKIEWRRNDEKEIAMISSPGIIILVKNKAYRMM